MRIEYHRTLIADRVRNDAFERALAAVVRRGETRVADVGAGTGLLGLFAAKLGAREVYLYEAAEVAGIAAEVIKRNRARNCHLLPCHSTEMVDPPQVDLIVSETLGNYAFEENIIETLADARKRFLAKGGKLIPQRITQHVAPVVADRIHRELCAWDDVGRGIDLGPAKSMSFNNVYVRTLDPAELLDGGTSAKIWDDVDLTRETRGTRKGEALWTVKQSATIYGFAVWWSAELVPGVSISTAPDAPRTHWEQLYFPLLEPIEAKPGERVGVALRSKSSEAAGTHLAWTATHDDAKGRQIGRHVHDLDKGWIP